MVTFMPPISASPMIFAESFKLDDPYFPEEEKAKVLAVAQSYFELAESYILEDN